MNIETQIEIRKNPYLYHYLRGRNDSNIYGYDELRGNLWTSSFYLKKLGFHSRMVMRMKI